jgi:hypothetical protein
MMLFPGRELSRTLLACGILAALSNPAPVAAQDHRGIVFGHIGGASIGHADSEQGTAPVFGGGIGCHLTPRLVVDADVHGGRVTKVFGREHHDFSQVTFTGSVLFRSSPDAPAHFLAGGGLAVQRAHRIHRNAVRPHRARRDDSPAAREGRRGVEYLEPPDDADRRCALVRRRTRLGRRGSSDRRLSLLIALPGG